MKNLKIENRLNSWWATTSLFKLIGRAKDENNMENDPRLYLYKLYMDF